MRTAKKKAPSLPQFGVVRKEDASYNIACEKYGRYPFR